MLRTTSRRLCLWLWWDTQTSSGWLTLRHQGVWGISMLEDWCRGSIIPTEWLVGLYSGSDLVWSPGFIIHTYVSKWPGGPVTGSETLVPPSGAGPYGEQRDLRPIKGINLLCTRTTLWSEPGHWKQRQLGDSLPHCDTALIQNSSCIGTEISPGALYRLSHPADQRKYFFNTTSLFHPGRLFEVLCRCLPGSAWCSLDVFGDDLSTFWKRFQHFSYGNAALSKAQPGAGLPDVSVCSGSTVLDSPIDFQGSLL